MLQKGMRQRKVVPYIGTWIETSYYSGTDQTNGVVPYIGTWIETSYPTNERGQAVSYLI